jgi:hypothetical protein
MLAWERSDPNQLPQTLRMANMTNPNGTNVVSAPAPSTEPAVPSEQIDLTAARPVDIDLTEAETIRLPEPTVDDGGDVARKPDEIVAEIEATRAELADTIDAIASRINPRKAASRAKAQVTGAATTAGTVSNATSSAAGAAPTAGPPAARAPFSDPKVLAVAGVVGAVIALLVFRRRR